MHHDHPGLFDQVELTGNDGQAVASVSPKAPPPEQPPQGGAHDPETADSVYSTIRDGLTTGVRHDVAAALIETIFLDDPRAVDHAYERLLVLPEVPDAPHP
jgi:hypothetical protein